MKTETKWKREIKGKVQNSATKKKLQRRGTQIIESKKERTERGKLGRSGSKRERRREGTQSCRVLNEAKKTLHLATPHTLPECHPKSVHNWPANCHKMQCKRGKEDGEEGSTSQATRPATIWLRQRVSRTNAPRVKPGRLPKNIEEGRSERERQRQWERWRQGSTRGSDCKRIVAFA